MNKPVIKRLMRPIFGSILLHIFGAVLFTYLIGHSKVEIVPQPVAERSIKVRSISKKELKKYRKVGIKNGKKTDTFSMKVPSKTSSSNKKQGQRNQKNLDLKNLQVSQNDIKQQKDFTRASKDTKKNNRLQVQTRQRSLSLGRTQQQRRKLLEQMGASASDASKMSNTDFGVKFEPPEGVSEDELNSAEKKYFSFQKRSFQSYIQSFILTYNKILRLRPQIQKPLREERHLLTGRVLFDKEGNIVSIKILKSSPNDDLHKLFEETLRGMSRLPNPPDDLVNADGTFTIYYQLKING